jgi:hypothetical protein
MSEYVVHFAKEFDGRDAYNNMLRILGSGQLQPGPAAFGAGRGLDALGDSQRSVCFSEIPLDLLERLVERRSKYGIGFTQEFLARRGGARVWYLDKDGVAARAFDALKAQKVHPFDAADPLWTLTPFVDFPGEYGDTLYRFEWEREWRVPGGLSFLPEDVSFLFMPEEFHDRARTFFADAEPEDAGPNYVCPYLDPSWGMDRIQEVLEELTSGTVSIPGEPRGWAEYNEGDEHDEDDEEGPDQCAYRMVVQGQCAACGHFHGETCLVCGGFHGL